MYVAIAVEDVLMLFNIDTTDKREAVLTALKTHPFREGIYIELLDEAVKAFSKGGGNKDTRELGVLAKTLNSEVKGFVTATLNYTEFNDIDIRVIADKPTGIEACFESLRISSAPVEDIKAHWAYVETELKTAYFEVPVNQDDFELAVLDCGWLVTYLETT